MQNNDLDKFFRNKLEQQGSAPFNPAHWAEAKKMLEDEKKNRKPFYWFLFAVAVVALVFSIFMLQNDLEHTAEPASIDKNQSYKIEMAESKSISTDKTAKDQKEVIGRSRINDNDVTETHAASGPTPNLTVGQDQPVSDNDSRLVAKELKTESDLDGAVNDLAEAENAPTIDLRNPMKLSPLSTPDYFLVYSSDLTPGRDLSPLDHAMKIRRKRLAWSASLLVDPAFTNVSPVKGFIVGITYEQYFKTHWLVGTRPSLQLRAGENGFSKFEQITTYGFSASNTTFGLKANNLQFLSLPLYLGGEFKSHTFELGVSLDLLLAARGQLQQVAVEDQSVVNIQNFNSGWIDTQHMQKLSTNLFFGYKHSLTNRLKTGITVFYNPTKIFPGLPNSQNQIVNSKWYLSWQATYYIK